VGFGGNGSMEVSAQMRCDPYKLRADSVEYAPGYNIVPIFKNVLNLKSPVGSNGYK